MSLLGCFGPWITLTSWCTFSSFIAKEECYTCTEAPAKCCVYCSYYQMYSFRPYSTQILHFFVHCQKSCNTSYWYFSTSVHQPSVGCLNISSLFRPSSFQCINFASLGFANKHFKQGIIGKYHITLYGIHVLISLLDLLLHLTLLCLYHGWLQTVQARRSLYSSPWYKIQYLIQVCIFCTSNPNGQITFFAKLGAYYHLENCETFIWQSVFSQYF
jgi:hypothetical protein